MRKKIIIKTSSMKKVLLLLFGLLAFVTANAELVKVNRVISLKLKYGVDYWCNSLYVHVDSWIPSNENVSLSIGSLNTICKVTGVTEGNTKILCNFQEYENGKGWVSKQKVWNITISGYADELDDDEEEDPIITFVHPDLHLFFQADTIERYAIVTSAGIVASEANSIVRPENEETGYLDYTNYWKNLVIPDSIEYGGRKFVVAGLGPYAFNKALEIETIKLPETITYIGSYAFNWCVNLKSINIPEMVMSIGTNCFTYCRELENIELPPYIESIGYAAFSDCKKLKEITIPSKCRSIGDEAFTWCRSLTKLIIEDSDSTLQLGYSQNLGVDYEIGAEWYDGPILRGQFTDCPIQHLYLGRNIKFPKSSGSISYLPFQRLQFINYDKNNNPIFFRMGKNYTTLELGERLTDIPDGLFSNAIIPHLELPSKLKTIGNNAFAGSSTYGSTLRQMELTLPETVESIGVSAFHISGLRYIYCNSQTPALLGSEDAFVSIGEERGIYAAIYVPEGTGSAYRNQENWNNYLIIDPSDEMLTVNVRTPGTLYSRLLAQDIQLNDVCRLKLKGSLNSDDWNILGRMKNLYDYDLSELTIQELPYKFFYMNASLVNIKLPNTLIVIDDSTFFSCERLRGVINIPSTCAKIGSLAFYNTGIEGLNYTGSIRIKDKAFRYCGNIKELDLEGEGTIVETWAFNATSIEKLTIGKGVTIDEEAFFFCENLNDIVFEDGVKSLGEGAFHYCYNVKKVKFEGLIDEVKGDPWEHDKGGPHLEYVNFTNLSQWLKNPMSYLATYAEKLLWNGEEITEVVVPEDITCINDNAFYNCKNLNNVKLHDGIKSIGSHAFYGCSLLPETELPKSIESIGDYAFAGWNNLTILDLPESINYLGCSAFENCSNLKKVVAHWTLPISSGGAFSGIPSDCYLYIPIGTSVKYVNNGWSEIPNIKEAGIMDVSVNENGFLTYNDVNVSGQSERFLFTPYKSFYIDITPKEGFRLVKMELNGTDVLSEVENNRLFVEEPEEDFTITAFFADATIEQGDVNGDGFINEQDAILAAKHILKSKDNDFHDYWGDMNDDKKINITDAIMIVQKYLSRKGK